MKKTVMVFILIAALTVSMISGCAQTNTTPGSPASTSGTSAVQTSAAASAQPSETASAQASNGKLDTVTVVLPRAIECLDDVHYVVAEEMGYFKQQGIDVQFQQASGTSDMQMIAAGKGDICLPHPFVALIGLTGGMPLKGVFQQDVINTDAFCVKADNNSINTIKDFKGKTIAVGDAAWEAIVNAELIAAGLTPSDVTYVVAGQNNAQMVSEGKCDIVYSWEKGYQLWLAQGMNFKVITCEDNLKICGNPLMVSTDTYNNKKDLITRFLRALSEGIYFTNCNPEAATRIVLKHFPTITTSFDGALTVAKAAAKIMSNDETQQYGYGYSDKERWDNCVKYSKLTGLITADISYDKIMTNEFIKDANTFDHDAVKADAVNYKQ